MLNSIKSRIDRETEEIAYYMDSLYNQLTETHGWNGEPAHEAVVAYFKGGVV